MGNDIKQKTFKWISEQGYPLEFRASVTYNKNRFAVMRGCYSRDSHRKPREIDILASKHILRNDEFLRVYHIVECKYTVDKPWVIFTEKAHMSESATISHTIGSDLGHAILWLLAGNKELMNMSMFYTPKRLGFNSAVAFSSKGTDKSYSTICSIVSKAVAQANNYDEIPVKPTKWGAVIFPIIVLEGHLFEAFWNESSNTIEINEQNRIRYNWRGSDCRRLITPVEIVTEEGLDEFLAESSQDIDDLLSIMENTWLELDKCYTNGSLDGLSIPKVSRGIISYPNLFRKIVNIESEE